MLLQSSSSPNISCNDLRKKNLKRPELPNPRAKSLLSPKRGTSKLNDQNNELNYNLSTRKNVLSPLQKKLEQESVEARAQRQTPELPQLQALVIDLPHGNKREDGNSDTCNSIRRRESSDSVLAPLAIHRSPSHRRLRVRTLEGEPLHLDIDVDIASTERMKRNTDSMLEDVIIASKLKRRLGSRRRELGISRKTIENTGLSDFIKKCIMEESLDAVSVARPTNVQLSHAADLAMSVCLEGYFENLRDERTKEKARQIFLESLIREEYNEGDYICRQHDTGDKLFIIEEGMVQFLIGNQVAGVVHSGNIFGELSLVYGIPRTADTKAITSCVMLWSLDALSFRRIQVLVANESLKASTFQSTRSAHVKRFRKEYSSLSDLQEERHDVKHAMNIDLNNLKRNAIIGKGTFGSVYLVSLRDKEKKKDTYFALKCMSKHSVVKRCNEKRVLIERNVLQALNSSFVISLMGTYQDDSSIYFLTDFVQGGNLMTYMIRKDVLSHSECVFFSANIVSALVHIHSKGFIHRDLKPENCLIDTNGYLKLCDLGMAKRLPSTVQLPNGGTEVVSLAFTMCGTPEFMAPEFVLSTGYDKGVDIWSLGCILIEMYTGRSPFEFDGNLKQTFKEVCFIGMGRKKFNVPEILKKKGFEDAEDFATKLLTPAEIRIGSDDTLELKIHTYFEGVDFGQLKNRQITAPYIPKLSHASDVSHFKKDAETASEENIEPYNGDNSWCEDF
jgi:serine/threonine protein kinase/CRP-like cAMP-binding protein